MPDLSIWHSGWVPSTTAELLDLLDLEDLDLDLVRGKQPRTTWQRTFGGQVLAQALVAGARTVPSVLPTPCMPSSYMPVALTYR